MIVVGFYIKKGIPENDFEILCKTFYTLGNIAKRKVDDAEGSAVYAISYNKDTSWVQLLIDDNTTEDILRIIRAKVEGLSDNGKFVEYRDPNDRIAPPERKREKI